MYPTKVTAADIYEPLVYVCRSKLNINAVEYPLIGLETLATGRFHRSSCHGHSIRLQIGRCRSLAAGYKRSVCSREGTNNISLICGVRKHTHAMLTTDAEKSTSTPGCKGLIIGNSINHQFFEPLAVII